MKTSLSRSKKKASHSIRLILLLALIIPTSGWTVTKVAEHFNFPTAIAKAFECCNYKKGYYERFNLIKPAIVSKILANRQWQLQERGVLEFI